MKIRKMALSDLPAVLPLALQLGYDCSQDMLARRLNELATADSCAIFVGEVSGAVMAFMQIQKNLTLLSGKRAELNSLVVDEQFRGKGYGRQMLAVAEEWAKNEQLPKLRLGSRTSRTDAHEFYKSYGFTVEKTWVVFSKEI